MHIYILLNLYKNIFKEFKDKIGTAVKKKITKYSYLNKQIRMVISRNATTTTNDPKIYFNIIHKHVFK